MILGIGTDLAEVARYHFDDAKLAWFSRKVYTPEEMRYAMRMRLWQERLAGFYAAKEATRKAFGFAIPWRLVGVSHEPGGRPFIRFYERARGLPDRFGVSAVHLTITHTKTMASAVVVLEGEAPQCDS
jgi:holo-[acyl-carrier protein] synthase